MKLENMSLIATTINVKAATKLTLLPKPYNLTILFPSLKLEPMTLVINKEAIANDLRRSL